MRIFYFKTTSFLGGITDQFSKKEKIITFGCSFKNDDHLLERLMLSDKLVKLKIGVFNQEDINNVYRALRRLVCLHSIYKYPGKLEKFEKNYKKISFFCTQKLGLILWNQPQSTHCKKLNLIVKDFDKLRDH